jgi:hypothetical protein
MPGVIGLGGPRFSPPVLVSELLPGDLIVVSTPCFINYAANILYNKQTELKKVRTRDLVKEHDFLVLLED